MYPMSFFVNFIKINIVRHKLLLTLLLLTFSFTVRSQIDINLYEQFNGRYDFTFVGNTLNPNENGNGECQILTSSASNLNLSTDDVLLKAYLYWAGSGTGDYNVTLNGNAIAAMRKFPVQADTDEITRPYFSAFADVTNIVKAKGNGTYTLSDLDLTSIINEDKPYYENIYCQNGTNFAGWALIIVYENEALPLNQLNLYDGLQFVPKTINISLPSLNVIDNEGAKIGFVAWEGDAGIYEKETLTINNNVLSNAPLNPPNNAFNGTNSVTNSSELYNMDLDIYSINNYIDVGDSKAEITLKSGQDFVMINVIITKLNSQLPDATITVENTVNQCDSHVVTVNYTVHNKNSTNALPAGTSVGIYVNGDLIATIKTRAIIPIGGSEAGTIDITVPDSYPDNIDIIFIVDYDEKVTETDETNNSYSYPFSFIKSPEVIQPENVTSCDKGFGIGVFDFSAYADSLKNDESDDVSFYLTQQEAESQTNAIGNTVQFTSTENPQRIYAMIDNGNCQSITSFLLITKKCKPTTYNYVTPNGDGFNDTFFVENLRNIFLNFKMSIYNRWGNLIWTGRHADADWDGIANVDKVGADNKTAPTGTYYYVLELNDPEYPEPLVGWVYVTL
jgi:gliding motility-associated-like protein